ncbi:MAG: hypothetical protein MN733_27570 [Nitrososphaera sp.]|nr:hypothetical protein [Nitrososphaera sp.]
MGVSRWLAQNWFSLLQSLAILAGLVFTGLSFRLSARTQQGTNLIAFKEEHRKLWTALYENRELKRVPRLSVDLRREPVTESERLFVKLLIAHLYTGHQLLNKRLLIRPVNLDKDVASFFSLPIPRAVWQKIKPLQDENFVKFVENVQSRCQG